MWVVNVSDSKKLGNSDNINDNDNDDGDGDDGRGSCGGIINWCYVFFFT